MGEKLQILNKKKEETANLRRLIVEKRAIIDAKEKEITKKEANIFALKMKTRELDQIKKVAEDKVREWKARIAPADQDFLELK